jgi:hypothetical protein
MLLLSEDAHVSHDTPTEFAFGGECMVLEKHHSPALALLGSYEPITAREIGDDVLSVTLASGTPAAHCARTNAFDLSNL